MLVKKNPSIYYLIFAVMLLLNIILRYPNQGIRGGGSDSWDYFTQANQIISEGKISWIYNLLSIYGFYPPYQEMGTPLIYASFSIVSGFSVHDSIFVVSLFLGIFSFLISNLFFRHIFNSEYIALIVALFFSCSPDISSSTSWVIHARYALTIFSFLLLFLIVKSFSTSINYRFSVLLFMSLIVFGTLHRSSIWLLFLTLLYFTLNLFSNRIKKYNVLPFSYKFHLVNVYFVIIFLTLFFQYKVIFLKSLISF